MTFPLRARPSLRRDQAHHARIDIVLWRRLQVAALQPRAARGNSTVFGQIWMASSAASVLFDGSRRRDGRVQLRLQCHGRCIVSPHDVPCGAWRARRHHGWSNREIDERVFGHRVARVGPRS